MIKASDLTLERLLMPNSRSGLHFSIAQGMAVIAAFAVALAFMPIGLVLSLSCVTAIWLLLRRKPRPNPSAYGEAFGCLSCLCGFVAGTFIVAMSVHGLWNTSAAGVDGGLLARAAMLSCGAVGAIVSGTAAQFVILPFVERPLNSPVRHVSKVEVMQKEVELVEQLLAQAQEVGDDEVCGKLTEYRMTLLQNKDEVVDDGARDA